MKIHAEGMHLPTERPYHETHQGFKLSVPTTTQHFYQPMFSETFHSIIQLDHRRSNSHIHLFIKPTRTPLHYLLSSRHKLDAWTTPVVQGYRVPLSNLPLLNRGNALQRWETTRRPRGGGVPLHTGFVGVPFLSRAAQRCSFFWGGGYHKVMLTDKEARRNIYCRMTFLVKNSMTVFGQRLRRAILFVYWRSLRRWAHLGRSTSGRIWEVDTGKGTISPLSKGGNC